MGDTVEITTWPNHQHMFYKVSSSVLSFEVKGLGNAAIGLSNKPGTVCDLIIALDFDDQSWIKRRHSSEVCTVVATPNLLSPDTYKKFWISWYGKKVSVGKDDHDDPMISYNYCRQPIFNYITFSVVDNTRNPVSWRFIVPPIIEKPLPTPVRGGELRWVEVDVLHDPLPPDAFIAGFENENLYVIRAPHSGSVTPGKYIPSKRLAFVSWSWESHPKQSAEILCGYNFIWTKAHCNSLPVGVVVGGYSENSTAEKLYVGRMKHMGHVLPGKVQRSHNVCFAAYGAKEIANEEFEVLVDLNKNRPHNKVLPHATRYGYGDEDDDDE